MNQDREQLRLLAIFHYVVAGLAALFSFFPLLYTTVGAICILIAGRSLAKRTRYWFALVVACIECLFVPFGTILGVFTIVVLSRESVKALFSTAQAPG